MFYNVNINDCVLVKRLPPHNPVVPRTLLGDKLPSYQLTTPCYALVLGDISVNIVIMINLLNRFS